MLADVDDAAADDRRRAQLETFIARSGRAKRITLMIGAACAASAAVLRIAGHGGLAVGAFMLGLFIAGTGMWISGGHIRDFEGELRTLDARRRARQ